MEAKIVPANENEHNNLESKLKRSATKAHIIRGKSSLSYNAEKEGHKDGEDGDDEGYVEEDADEMEVKKDIIEYYRVKVKKLLATSTGGRLYDNVLLILSVMSSLEFIYQTYLDPVIDANILRNMDIAEQFLAVLFSVDWLLNLFLADHRLMHLYSFYSMIDILTVIPIWVSVYSYVPNYSEIQTVRDGFVYFLVGLATTRILRALRIRKKLIVLDDEVQRCVGEIILTLVVMILFFTALMQYIESEYQPLPFHVFMYFITVTVTTVGYGDISPDSTLGKMVIMLMIFTGVGLIPKLTGELIETTNRSSVYARANFHPKGKAATHSHVVICGEIGSLALREFFNELFHEDHENLNLHAVLLCQDGPTNEMGALLRDPLFSMNITYLEGTALSQQDLKRASASLATSIFIMTNKFSSNPDEEDAKTILQQFSIKQHITAHEAKLKSIPLLCIQIVRPENRRHLIPTISKDDSNVKEDLVMCLNELKMGVIAKAVMFPGTNTLIMNLLTSFADDDDDDDDDDTMLDIDPLNNDDSDHWMTEYQRGCDWEIYTTELSEKFEGATFIRLSEMLYQRLGIVLFALQIEDLQKDKSNIRVLLNPSDFIIPSKADFKIDAFVIAKNANQSDLTFSDHDDAILKDSDRGIRQSPATLAALAEARRLESEHAKRELQLQSEALLAASNSKELKPWQKLLRKYDSNSHSIGSDQEIRQKVEELYLRDNYFTLWNRAILSENTVRTTLDYDFPLITGHTIIVGKSLSSIYDLIKNLRAKYLEVLRHIVVLTPIEMPHNIWSRISVFRCVLYLRGSPLEEEDILRAGVFKASQVIVLADSRGADSESSKKRSKTGGDALIDADAVFSYQCVRRMNEACVCVVEIVRSENVGYLDPQGAVKSGGQVDYKFTPQFASGALFTTALLDTLVCQAFYNTKIIAVISELFSGVERKSKHDLEAVIRGDELTRKKGVAAIVGSTLFQIAMPELENRTYGHLFKHLSLSGIIPLGLYRGVFPYMHIGPKQNKAPYCYCNPSKDTELFSCDKVYVLSPKALLKSNKKNVKLAESAMESRTVAQDDPQQILQAQMDRIEKKIFDRVERLQEALETSLSANIQSLTQLVSDMKG